jgi:UDP-galactopyranose mutase
MLILIINLAGWVTEQLLLKGIYKQRLLRCSTNKCGEKIPFTRITEHTYFAPQEQHDKAIYFTEYE